MFGERDLFLSIFNPRYFIDVLGTKGRDLLERYLHVAESERPALGKTLEPLNSQR